VVFCILLVHGKLENHGHERVRAWLDEAARVWVSKCSKQ
jgi:hypothetical protein